ncbi:MAG TPA: hypothetical protein VFJ76_07960 [Solirubrobacterales bacterium]|nr:hypothetical protein [Solirubrobacterales bacterium]
MPRKYEMVRLLEHEGDNWRVVPADLVESFLGSIPAVLGTLAVATALRASQVETLRAVADYPRPISPAELGGLVGPPGGLSVGAARARLERLRADRFLCAHLVKDERGFYHRARFSLSQLGKEALASSGKEAG